MGAWIGRPRIFVLPLVGVLALAVGVGARTQSVEKSIFVSVVDGSGKPVKDMTAAEFAIREDNMNREITSAKLATQPLNIQILADTTKESGAVGMMTRAETSSGASEVIRDIRTSLTAFVKHVAAAAPATQIALMEFGQASIPVVNFTSNVADVEKGINKLFPKPDAASVLLEAMMEANKQLERRPSPRRAMVILNIEPGDEQSTRTAQRDPRGVPQVRGVAVGGVAAARRTAQSCARHRPGQVDPGHRRASRVHCRPVRDRELAEDVRRCAHEPVRNHLSAA